MEYWQGMMDERSPGVVKLDEIIERIVDVAATLPAHRQSDLLAISEMFSQVDRERMVTSDTSAP
jgi:hypothetical protein